MSATLPLPDEPPKVYARMSALGRKGSTSGRRLWKGQRFQPMPQIHPVWRATFLKSLLTTEAFFFVLRLPEHTLSASSGRSPIRHWITSSARSNIVRGIVMPRAIAVLRLITSSYLVGCSTGNSAGLAPLRILST